MTTHKDVLAEPLASPPAAIAADAGSFPPLADAGSFPPLAAGGHVADMSAAGLFLQADPVVKGVILLLLLFSVWSWAIIFMQLFTLRRLGRHADRFENAFWSGEELEKLAERIGSLPSHPVAAVFLAAMSEWRCCRDDRRLLRSGNLLGRLSQVMRVVIDRETGILERHSAFLATVGSAAPFVGLFGTVWGIMNSFSAIGQTGNTSLAVVAPGIAEALFATAVGLAAAIPATIAYNRITAGISRYSGRLEGFASELLTLISRQLDESNLR